MSIPVISIIKPVGTPIGSSGSSPVVEDVDFLGGYRVASTLAAMYAIPQTNHKQGMLVYVISGATFWQRNASAYTGTSSDWTGASFSSAGGFFTTSRTTDGTITITNTASNIAAGFLGLTNNRTGTLPAAPATGQQITIIDKDGSLASFNFTINGNGKNINGVSTFIMTNSNVGPRGSISMIFDGTDWSIV